MKIFAIRDETDAAGKDLGYLLYYEIDKRFYIELPEEADSWETPFLLSSFVKKGERTVNAYWSKAWVQQRIVPPDRQNIAQILRDSGSKTYDEYKLLTYTGGRCEQDDYYLQPICENDMPKEILRRFSRKIEDVVPLKNNCLLVFFCNGTVKKCDLIGYFEKMPHFSVLVKRVDWFERVQIQTGGYGVQWDENLTVSDSVLYSMGKAVPLTAEDFKAFSAQRVINAAEAAEILNCSRQYVSELVKTGKLHPVKATEKTTLFMKSEVLQRSWK